MLAAYAGHAAAALDLLIALEDARQEADRAGALLDLAHELAAATDAAAVTRRGGRGAAPHRRLHRASILLWDPAAGVLRTSASVGMTDEQRRAAHGRRAAARGHPRAGRDAHRPRAADPRTTPPAARRCGGLLRGIGTADVVAVPLLAGTTFLGVATAGWGRRGADRRSTATSSPGCAVSATRRPPRCRRPGCSRPSATRPRTTP